MIACIWPECREQFDGDAETAKQKAVAHLNNVHMASANIPCACITKPEIHKLEEETTETYTAPNPAGKGKITRTVTMRLYVCPRCGSKYNKSDVDEQLADEPADDADEQPAEFEGAPA